MKIRLGMCALIGALGMSTHAFAQEAYLGEIRQFASNYCPRGWAPADGATLQIAQNTALFSLLGTTYGGDGRATFALPRISPPMSNAAPAASPGQAGGEARIYEHCDLEGWSVPLGLGDHRANELARPPYSDNNVSAVRASPGWTVTLFDGANLDGQSVTVTGENRCLVAQGFNDMTSSIRVTRAPPPEQAGQAGVTCIALQGAFPSRP
jgi:microcystin-dependent protein